MGDVYLSGGVRRVSDSTQSLKELYIEAADALLAGRSGAELDAVVLASAHPVELNSTSPEELCSAVSAHLRSKGWDIPVKYFHKPSVYVREAHLAASATGAALLHEGIRMVAFDSYSAIGLIAAEQMRSESSEKSISSLRSLIHPEEQPYGTTMPALAGLLTSWALKQNPALEEALLQLTVNTHAYGSKNPRAHIRKAFSADDFRAEAGKRNAVVSSPLHLWEVAPRSAGYAALVLSGTPPDDEVKVKVAGYGQGTDTLSLAARDSFTSSQATCAAMGQLRSMIDHTPGMVRYTEIHDAFPILAYLGLLDTGLLCPDTAIDAILAGETALGGRIPVNLSGGVSCGHALAASGLGQIVELMKQAKGEAEVQIPDLAYPHYCLATSVGGFNTYNVVTLLHASKDGSESFALREIPDITAADFDTGLPEANRDEGDVIASTELYFPPPGFGSPLLIELRENESTGKRYLVNP